MPNIADHVASTRVKALLMGDPGSGKTTVCATLANSGYNTRIIDSEEGLDGLIYFLTEEGASRTHYQTVATYTEFSDILSKGWVSPENLGKIQEWGPEDVLVIDTLTTIGEMALRGFQGNKSVADRRDYHQAQQMVIGVLSFLMSKLVKCNVLVTTHIQPDEDERGILKYLPMSGCGAGLSARLGKWFNNVWCLETKLRGSTVERKIRTASSGKMDLKNTRSDVMLDLEDADLAKIFDKIKGKGD